MAEKNAIQSDRMVEDRLVEAEQLLNEGKVKLPEDELKRVEEGINRISEKIRKCEPVFAKDFDFVDELRGVIRIVGGYNEAMENLKDGILYHPEYPIEGDRKAPTQEEVIHALMTKLTPDQKEVIAQMKNPVLLVKPITTHVRFARNITEKRHLIFISVTQQLVRDEKANGITDKITGWEVGFAEGTSELEGDGGKVVNLIDKWKRGSLFKKGAKIITFNEYMLLMGSSIKKGNPIDRINWSILRKDGKEEIIDKNLDFSFGQYGDDDGMYIDSQLSLSDYDKVRFRYAVMVEI